MAKRFEGKVVIITGSSAGIGQDAAVEFGKEGARLVIHGQNSERLDETETLLLDAGVRQENILKVLGSMEDPNTPSTIVEKTVQKFDRIDVLINNAGASSKPGITNQHSLENLDFLFKVNLRSVIELTQRALPYLEQTKGNVINVSSASAKITYTVAAFYSSIKATLDHFTRNYAYKYSSRGVRINSINPGFVRTLIFQRNKGAPNSQERVEQHAQNCSLKRIGMPSEVSPALMLLASDESAHVTGVTWLVDGGITLYSPLLDLDDAMILSI
ncbi:enoyl-(Acyl carrier protein) reductase domain-containing protein [Ditylenchus destructor]|uniref:Enoyl-(Acyl carrier protein) reductase domain-containing protein n=1 Tax=Ditylenchus destructor TaxID=166010 RepID=A0AAD4R704_9BILA|nr:enoyl-(Acyl carrier protein) reductase domain-containing protein [Ditylenchus destructor]